MQVEVKVRVFIPAPAIFIPLNNGAQAWIGSRLGFGINNWLGFDRVFGGDGFHGGGNGRFGQYNAGTSRGEVTATVDLATGTVSHPERNKKGSGFQWFPSTEYEWKETLPVAGRPKWFLDLRPGARPIRQRQLQLSESTLQAERIEPAQTMLSREYFIGFVKDLSWRAEPLPPDGATPMRILRVHIRGRDALLPIVIPPLYAELFFIFQIQKGKLRFSVFGKHGGFPAHEVFIKPQGHQHRLIHSYDPVAAHNSVLALATPTAVLHTKRIALLNQIW